MTGQCRNKFIGTVTGLPAYVSMAALCLVGLTKTTVEMSAQHLWFAGAVAAAMICASAVWLFNVRKVRVGIVDIAAAAAMVWYAAAYRIDGGVAVPRLLEAGLFAPMYVSLRVLLSSYRNAGRWLFAVLCICGIVEAVTGMQQAFGVRHSNHNLFNVTGTFFNPGPYGGYVAVVLSTVLGYVAAKYRYADGVFGRFRNLRRLRLRGVLWAAVFTAAVCAVIATVMILPSTMSRAAFVAIAVAGAAVVLSDRKVYGPAVGYVRKHRVGMTVAAILTFAVVCGGAYGIYALKKDSADGRLLMWKIGAKVMTENPVTGVGQGNFRGAFGDAQAEYFRTGERSETEVKVAGCPEYGFNEYLQTGAETGVTGLALLLFLSAAALWSLFRARSCYAFGLLALLVFAFFSYPFSILPMKMLLVFFLAVAGTMSRSRKHRPSTVAERVSVGVALAGCILIGALTAKPYLERLEAAEKWQEQRRWYSMEFYSYVVEDYPELFEQMKDNPTFLFEYGRALHLEKRYSESIGIMTLATRLSNDPMNYNVLANNYKALGEYDKAAGAYLDAWYMVPNRMYPLYLLGKMYAEIGDGENAARYARRVVEMTPKVESPATRDMQSEMKEILKNSGKYEE